MVFLYAPGISTQDVFVNVRCRDSLPLARSAGRLGGGLAAGQLGLFLCESRLVGTTLSSCVALPSLLSVSF